MTRSFLTLLPLLALCLPVSAEMIAGLSLGEKKKAVLRKVADSPAFTPMSSNAKFSLENTYRLTKRLAGQRWQANFIFNSRTRELNELVFLNDKPMRPEQFHKLLKPFYVFTNTHIREHFKLDDPINIPDFGQPGMLEEGKMYPLHAYPGKGFLLTTGLWKDKTKDGMEGGIRLCFSMIPSSDSALGSTDAENTSGNQADWDNIPAFEASAAGKAFLLETGLATEEDFAEKEKDVPAPVRKKAMAKASSKLPQAEQDMLNALLLLNAGETKEGVKKLTAAAKAGNPRALYELGCCYADGLHGVKADPRRAEDSFRKAAQAGYALALVRYGAEFSTALKELGLTEADGKNMINALYGAVGGPCPSYRFNYATMLRYGYGVRKDTAQALKLMEQLIREGDPTATALAEEWAE